MTDKIKCSWTFETRGMYSIRVHNYECESFEDALVEFTKAVDAARDIRHQQNVARAIRGDV